MRNWLIQARKARNLSSKATADLVGVSAQIYCHYETGYRNPRVATAKKIGETLGFDWTRFYSDEDESHPESK